MTPIPQDTRTDTPALLALRRSLWQLAFVGLAGGATLARLDPGAVTAASWCALVPLLALAVHYRGGLARALARLERIAPAPHGAPGMRPAQARRTRRARGVDLPRRRLRGTVLRAVAATGWFVPR